MRDGHAIAVARNFEMRLPGFEISEYYSCTNKFPELYGIKRAAILK